PDFEISPGATLNQQLPNADTGTSQCNSFGIERQRSACNRANWNREDSRVSNPGSGAIAQRSQNRHSGSGTSPDKGTGYSGRATVRPTARQKAAQGCSRNRRRLGASTDRGS